jgi:hypothetical protein
MASSSHRFADIFFVFSSIIDLFERCSYEGQHARIRARTFGQEEMHTTGILLVS